MSLRNILFFALVAIAVNSYAGINKKYVQRIGIDGATYHIFSQKMPSIEKNNNAKDISFDYTYSEQTDSVIMLITVEVPHLCSFEDITLSYCENSYSAEPKIIYVEPKGNKYQCRIGISIPFKTWVTMYDCTTPYKVSICISSNHKIDTFNFGYSGKKWAGHFNDIRQIIDIIKFNKQ